MRTLDAGRDWRDPRRFKVRAEALDLLDRALAFVDVQDDVDADVASLHEQAETLDAALFAELRDALRQGRPDTLLAFGREATVAGTARGARGYDWLDDLVAGVLALEPPPDVAAPPAEMVFYQPTPARHVFDLIVRAGIGAQDVLVDLGAGLGHVPLLVSLCTGAFAVGIERERDFVAIARRGAASLAATRVVFMAQDARAADLSAGTVFHLYTPFGGAVLRGMLDALRREAAQRPIRLTTLGPCVDAVAAEPWLRADAAPDPERITVFRSGG